jgi:3-phosphoshikimate 1-carboxyvinyltransferase
MTLRLMDQWGAHAAMDGDVIIVPGGQSYSPGTFTVEPDATSASYFAAAAALIGGLVELRGLKRDSVQGDTAFIEVLARMGAHVEWTAGGVRITGTGSVHGVDLEMNDTPDVVPTLAAIAPFASSSTRIRKVAFIRHHESDRLAALAMELRRIGAVVTELPDGLEIIPSQTHAAAVETYNDHRIAMAFAIAGLKTPGIRIKDPGCVAKTYPGFFDDLKSLY